MIIHFEFDSDRLSDLSKHKLLNWVNLHQEPITKLNIQLEGHTDNIGSEEYNLNEVQTQ
jgi:outer membrane protein OmpA-like peptidoglycan-associated protein